MKKLRIRMLSSEVTHNALIYVINSLLLLPGYHFIIQYRPIRDGPGEAQTCKGKDQRTQERKGEEEGEEEGGEEGEEEGESHTCV